MVSDSLSKQSIPMTEFMRLYDKAPFELINGERIPVLPGIARHVETIQAILFILKQFLDEHSLGRVYSEAPFVLEDKPDWVKGSRVPDVMFIAEERFQAYIKSVNNWRDKPFILIPDLAIEVVSPNDRYSDLNRKVLQYLDDGVKAVWVIDPQARNAMVYHHDEIHIIQEDAYLSGASIITGFEIILREFLPDESV